MREKLYPASEYPHGHAQLVEGTNHVAFFLHAASRFPEAQPYFEQALAVTRALYPKSRYGNGHIQLQRALHNMASNLHHLGKLDLARAYQEEGVAMLLALYPDPKSPDDQARLAFALNLLGMLRDQTGDTDNALPILEQASDLILRVTEQAAAVGAEDDALALLRATPPIRANYLAAARKRPGREAAAYRLEANARSAITRVLAERAAALRAAGPDQAAALAQLREVRRRTETLLLCGDLAAADRSRQLAELTTENDRLERELARTLKRRPPRPPFAAAELIKAVPPGSAFVEYFTYGGRYTAFVLAPGQPIRWVDLPNASQEVVQHGVEGSRDAIEAKRESDNPAVAALVWQPVARVLPAGTRTLYVAPADHLWLMPWAALPSTKPGRVLLEECPGGIALVQHGADLLAGLTRTPREDGPAPVLTVSGVAYGSPPRCAPLPGTEVEAQTIRTLAGQREVVALTGPNASVAALMAELPRHATPIWRRMDLRPTGNLRPTTSATTMWPCAGRSRPPAPRCRQRCTIGCWPTRAWCWPARTSPRRLKPASSPAPASPSYIWKICICASSRRATPAAAT